MCSLSVQMERVQRAFALFAHTINFSLDVSLLSLFFHPLEMLVTRIIMTKLMAIRHSAEQVVELTGWQFVRDEWADLDVNVDVSFQKLETASFVCLFVLRNKSRPRGQVCKSEGKRRQARPTDSAATSRLIVSEIYS